MYTDLTLDTDSAIFLMNFVNYFVFDKLNLFRVLSEAMQIKSSDMVGNTSLRHKSFAMPDIHKLKLSASQPSFNGGHTLLPRRLMRP